MLFSGNASARDSGPLHFEGDTALDQAKVDGYCTGDGTEGSPYVFADYNITCTGEGYGIWLKDTTRYVNIENCTIHNCQYVSETLRGYGVYLQNCSSVTVNESAFSDCDYGIVASQSDNCTLLNNDINSISTIGISIEYSYWVITDYNFKNIIGTTPTYGILVKNSQYVAINDTAIVGCIYGIAITDSSRYVIMDNVTLDRQAGQGINVDHVSEVTITNSTFTNFGDYSYGIYGQQVTYIDIQNNIYDLVGTHAQGIALFTSDQVHIGHNRINDTVYAIFLDDAENVTVDSNICTNTSDFNMRLTIQNGRVQNNTVASAPFGISFMNCIDVTVLDNDLTVTPSFGSEGFNLYQCQDMRVEDNVIDFETGEFNKPVFLTLSSNCQIVNNTITGLANTGIAVYSSSNILISGNYLATIGSIGINLDTIHGAAVFDNTIEGGLETGLLVSLSHDLHVYGNDLESNHYGIVLQNSYDATIEGNYANWSMVRGISVESGGSYSNVTVRYNFCVNCDTGIVVSAIGNVVVEDNDCSYGSNAGIFFSESMLSYAGNNTATHCGVGIDLGDSQGCMVHGGSFDYCNVGVSVGNEGGNIENVSASHCGAYGLQISNAMYTFVSNSTFSWNVYGISVNLDINHEQPITVKDCFIENNSADGLHAYGGHWADVFGNHFANNLDYGIYLGITCNSWWIYNNTFLNNNGISFIDPNSYQCYDQGTLDDWFVWAGDRNWGNGWSNLPNVDLNEDSYVDDSVWIGGSYLHYQYQLPYGPKIEAPAAPTGLVGVLSSCYIDLNWTEPVHGGNATVVYYYVYMGLSPGSLEFIGNTYGELFYQVNYELVNGNIYYFAVAAVNNYDFVSELSNIMEVNYTLYPLANSGPLIIHSDQEFADMADLKGWVGDGSVGSPYVIEDLIIDGSGWEDCIEIWHTTVHFVVRNCTFYFGTLGMSGNGIGLLDVVNGQFFECTFAGEMLNGINSELSQFIVEQCTFSGPSNYAVLAQYGFGILVANSTFDGCNTGIGLFSFNDVTIRGSSFLNCLTGVYAFEGEDLEVSENTAIGGRFIDLSVVATVTVEANVGTDIELFGYFNNANNVQVRNNTVDGNGNSVGLNIYQGYSVIVEGNSLSGFTTCISVSAGSFIQLLNNTVIDGSYNGMYLQSISIGLIEGNNVSGNGMHGMQLGSGISGLTVRGNIFGDNLGYGVYIDQSISATFTLNMFRGNNGNDGTYSTGTIQAFDKYLSCQWSSGGYGNYWAEWTSPDVDYDGIVDQPYGLGEEEYLDYAPLAHAFGVPTSLQAQVGNSWALLSWDEVIYDFTSGVDGYVIYRSLDAGGPFASIGTTTARHFNNTGLTMGTTYYYRVAAYRGAEIGSMCLPLSVTPCNTPGAPTGLSVSRGIGSLELSWTAPTDHGGAEITGYAIYRGTNPSSLAFLGNTLGIETIYFDGPFGNGETYYYAVRAINQAGPGAASATVGNTTFDAPSAPLNVDTQFGNHNVTVSWNAPSSDGGTLVTGYVVEVSHSGGSGYYYFGPAVRNALIISLANGVEYGFRVYAVNIAGEGDWSTIIYDTPATLPGAPEGLVAVPGNSSVSLSWQLPSDDGGDAPTSYNIYRMDLENGWALLGNSTVRSYVDSTVINGMIYYYRVSAVNKAGEGSISKETGAVPGLPLAPTGLTATNDGGNVRLNWTAPADDGGTDIVGYKVYRDGGSGFIYLGSVSAGSLSYLDATATPGIEYRYRVSAVTLNGEGSPSNAAILTLPLTSPEAPVIDSAVQEDDGVLIVWHVPESSTVPDQFLIYRGAASDSLMLIAIIDGDVLEYLDLAGTADMFYALRSSNQYGVSEMSAPYQATLGIVLPPEAPQGLTAIAGDSLVTLSWTASNGAVGYRVYRDNGSGYALLDTVAGVGYSDGTVLNGVPCSYRLTAYNDGGESGNSTTVLATPGSVPGAVQNLTLTEGAGIVTLDWEAPADDGGSAVLGYRVYRDLDGTVTLQAMVNIMTYTDHNVVSGLPHTYWVVALNAWGAGPESARVNVTPDEVVVTGLPAPSYLLATVGNGTVTLTWDPMVSFHVNGFRVFRSDGGNFTFLSAQNGSSYTDVGLVNGVTYTYRVYCFIGTANGENATVDATPGTVPGAATLNAQTAVDRITLGWSVPANGGSSIIGYRLYRTPGIGTTVLLASLTGNAYVDTSVLAGVNYTYMVTALNAFGEGAPSNTMVLRTNQQPSPNTDAPAAPYLISATGGNSSVTLLWSVPSDTGDGPITGYNVYRGTSPLALQLLVSVPAGSTTYVDGAAVYGTTYYYCVSALNQWGEGEPSRVLSASLVALAVPGEVNVEVEEGQGRLTLTWSVPDDQGSSAVTGYNIYRRGEGGDRQLIATVPAGTDTFVDGSVEPGAEYDYWVTAVNAAGEGPLPDAPVSGVPLAVITGVASPGPLPLIAVALGVVGLLVAVVAIVLVLRKK